MGASKKTQMKGFDVDWADQIWKAAAEKNGGKGAGYLLPMAALALTGCRPAALEKGIEFTYFTVKGRAFISAKVPGTKAKFDKEGNQVRGQPEITLNFDQEVSRFEEFLEILKAVKDAPDKKIVITYDAEAISTRLRELSKTIWPRRKNQITAYCYRELFSSTAKGAEMPPEDIAAAMGHISTESQGKYASRTWGARGGAVKPRKPFTSAKAPVAIKSHRSPMTRFKIATKLKKMHSPS